MGALWEKRHSVKHTEAPLGLAFWAKLWRAARPASQQASRQGQTQSHLLAHVIGVELAWSSVALAWQLWASPTTKLPTENGFPCGPAT